MFPENTVTKPQKVLSITTFQSDAEASVEFKVSFAMIDSELA